jgi:hypothetical protein
MDMIEESVLVIDWDIVNEDVIDLNELSNELVNAFVVID